MDQHLTETDIRALRRGGLPAPQLIAAHEHLAECADCRRRSEALLTPAAPAAVRDAFQLGPSPERPHPEFEALAAFLDGSHAPDVQAHLDRCSQCRGEMRAMDAIRRELRDSPAKVYAPTGRAGSPSSWAALLRVPALRPALAAGAAALLAVAVLVSLHPGQVPPVTGAGDGPSRVEAREHGGGSLFTPSPQARAEADAPTPERPVSSALTAQHPTLVWSVLNGADHYQVSLNAPATPRASVVSGHLAETQWTVPRRLPTDVPLQWTVQAYHGDQTLGPPSRPATFRVR